MSVMIAFGLASIMLCIGMILRTKIPFFRNMLVPASVLAGVIGMVVMNTGLNTAIDATVFTSIVTHLFTLTFISIGLTGSSSGSAKKGSSAGKEITKGSIGMGFIWNVLYALTPVVGVIVLLLIGSFFGMHAVYGLLIPFAFTQGPGQAAAFGTIFEQQYGIENAAMVGMTFAAIGFLACFFVGVPLAKYGLKKGLVKNLGNNQMDGFVHRGYYAKNEKKGSMGEETIYSGNMDTMTFHFAVMGISFLMALGMAELISYIPGIGASLSGMLFIYGLLSAYIVKFVMKKLKIDHMLDNTFQSKITGWATDYLIVASFMAVQFSIIGEWIVPIIIVAAVTIVLTVVIVLYFGKRFGGEEDFVRTLGLFGSAMGTVPSGLSLIRIIDPSFRSNVPVELGMMNVPMMLFFVKASIILSIASGAVSITVGILLLMALIPVYLLILKIFNVWGRKTYDFKGKTVSTEYDSELM